MADETVLTKAAGSPLLSAWPQEAENSPLCVIVDEDVSIRHFLSAILQGAEVDTEEFADGNSFRAQIGQRMPSLVAFDVPLQNADVMESMIALGESGYRGPVLLMSNRGAAVMENTKRVGEQNKLNILPVLKKPFDAATVQKILQDAKIGTPPPMAARIGLHEALERDWIEFWCRPKIDLRKRQLAGAVVVPRARHPQFGVLAPNAFMPGADDKSIAAITGRTLEAGLKTGSYFARLGIQLQISATLALDVLEKLPVADIIDGCNNDPVAWPGLTINIAEKQIADHGARARAVIGKLNAAGLKVAIEGVGRGYAKLTEFSSLQMSELKLDPTIVTDCALDRGKSTDCRTIVDFAHDRGCVVAALGLEKPADVVAQFNMGCDFGEGPIFGRPMSRARFTSLLRQRLPAALFASQSPEKKIA
jgi:EAL domain-containing protein (putative c-di-GMP-specific phosphodiesterase class I)